MKRILVVCALVLVAGAALAVRSARMPSRYGEFTGAPKVDVAGIVARPQDFLRKTVTIEGIVREQCTTMGCFFFFHVGGKTLRVDIEQIAMKAPRRNGRVSRVEGQV